MTIALQEETLPKFVVRLKNVFAYLAVSNYRKSIYFERLLLYEYGENTQAFMICSVC